MELRPNPYYLFLIFSVLLLRYAVSQCSEAHRQACSFTYIQLQITSADITTTSNYIPEYNETTLRKICSLFNKYKECTKPFLETCNSRTVRELQTYNITLGPICGTLLTEYLSHRSCYKLLHTSYTSCKEKALSAILRSDVSSPGQQSLCSAAKDYVLCAYTATALGCSMTAADVYFKLLNHTFTTIFDSNTYHCTFRHPMDEISIYTTSPRTTTNKHYIPTTTDGYSGTHNRFKEVSIATTLHSFDVFGYLVIVLTYFVVLSSVLQTERV